MTSKLRYLSGNPICAPRRGQMVTLVVHKLPNLSTLKKIVCVGNKIIKLKIISFDVLYPAGCTEGGREAYPPPLRQRLMFMSCTVFLQRNAREKNS